MAGTDAIGGGSAVQRPNLQAAGLGQEEFLKILLTQLQFQDPLKPLDNQEFLAQMAQFSALAQSQEMNGRIETLLNIQSAEQSIGLIGKAVVVQSEGGDAINGTVVAINFVEGSPRLTVQTSSGQLNGISLSQITVVANLNSNLNSNSNSNSNSN